MADLSITATSVVEVAGAGVDDGVAGATITAGQTVYKKISDNKFYLADCDATAVGANAEIDNVYGIALNGAAVDQALSVQKTGTITIGATTVVGVVYVQSATAGGIAPWGDLVSTDYVTIIGYALTTSTIKLAIDILGVQEA